MDDMYICLEFIENIPVAERETVTSILAARIADCLYQKLELRLSTKTRLYWLNIEKDKNDLLKNLKRVSSGHDIADSDDNTDVNEKLELIFKQLEKLKGASLNPTFAARVELDDEIIKEVYNDDVSALLHKPEHRERIHNIFADFNFDSVMAQPREILMVMLVDQQASEHFKEFLINKTFLTSSDVSLVLHYLCQIDFKSEELINLLQNNTIMSKIIEIYKEGSISTSCPGYFDLPDSRVLGLCQYANVIEQIRLRVQCERRHDFSVGLNHLLNEVHGICHYLDPRASRNKTYESIEVLAFLMDKRVPHETCIKIRNLFDRRNKTQVSHPDPIAWPVSETEYYDYYGHVRTCLSCIL